jgi:predicted enzyme related to lactoylglutathione lyase
VEQLRSEGVEIAGDITEHPWGRIATFEDPDGSDLQLYEPPAE